MSKSYRNSQHQETAILNARRTRQERKAHGVCTRCGQSKERLDVTECDACKVKQEASRKLRCIARTKAGLCISCKNPVEIGFTTCHLCRMQRIHNYRKIKRAVIDHYGGCCVQCGDARLGCLEIDHINNDGAAHRKLIDGSSSYRTGTKLYQYIFENNFNTSFALQVLCASCHAMKHWITDEVLYARN